MQRIGGPDAGRSPGFCGAFSGRWGCPSERAGCGVRGDVGGLGASAAVPNAGDGNDRLSSGVGAQVRRVRLVPAVGVGPGDVEDFTVYLTTGDQRLAPSTIRGY